MEEELADSATALLNSETDVPFEEIQRVPSAIV